MIIVCCSLCRVYLVAYSTFFPSGCFFLNFFFLVRLQSFRVKFRFRFGFRFGFSVSVSISFNVSVSVSFRFSFRFRFSFSFSFSFSFWVNHCEEGTS